MKIPSKAVFGVACSPPPRHLWCVGSIILLLTAASLSAQITIKSPIKGVVLRLSAENPPSVKAFMSTNQDRSATWVFKFSYQLPHKPTPPPTQGTDILGRTENVKGANLTISEQGGMVDVIATQLNTKNTAATVFYIDGMNPSADAVKSRLIDLYKNSSMFPAKGTANLLACVVQTESTSWQFDPTVKSHPKYIVKGNWPRANIDGAPYYGLMQVGPKPTMSQLYSWIGNTAEGLSTFEGKIRHVLENQQKVLQKQYPKMPSLSPKQLEDNALFLYGGWWSNTVMSGNYRWISNSSKTGWIANPNIASKAATYITKIRNGDGCGFN